MKINRLLFRSRRKSFPFKNSSGIIDSNVIYDFILKFVAEIPSYLLDESTFECYFIEHIMETLNCLCAEDFTTTATTSETRRLKALQTLLDTARRDVNSFGDFQWGGKLKIESRSMLFIYHPHRTKARNNARWEENECSECLGRDKWWNSAIGECNAWGFAYDFKIAFSKPPPKCLSGRLSTSLFWACRSKENIKS